MLVWAILDDQNYPFNQHICLVIIQQDRQTVRIILHTCIPLYFLLFFVFCEIPLSPLLSLSCFVYMLLSYNIVILLCYFARDRLYKLLKKSFVPTTI